MQDIIKPQSERRSVRNIAIDRPQTTSQSTDTATAPGFSKESSLPPMPPSSFPRIPRTTSHTTWYIVGGVVLAIILVFVVGSFFAGAHVAITPRYAVVNLDSTFTAYRDPAPGAVGFEIVEVSKESSRSVKATGEERIERPASGKIVVYNNYDDKPQKLIKNTRFETPDGKIYRIQESITVPGQTKDASGQTVPGSVEATVFADSAGESYNIDLTDFTIPGFKEGNDPRYNAFYARSKTAMTGGFAGTVKTASDADTKAAEAEIDAELRESLKTDATVGLAEGFVVLPESAQYSFESLPNKEGENGNVMIARKGTLTLLAVNKDAIASAAAAERIAGYAGESVTFSDTDELSFQIVTEPFDIVSATATDIRVTGPSTLVWTFDAEDIKGKLATKSRSDASGVFSTYPGIEKADIVIRPFWKRSFPSDTADIEISIEEAGN